MTKGGVSKHMSVKRPLALCFSGHRPEKLPGKGKDSDPGFCHLLSILYLEIENALKDGYTVFYSGMARGIDLWAAKFIIEQRRTHPELQLICVIPYKNQNLNFRGTDKWDYSFILSQADEVICLSEEYTKDCLRKRNEYMVNHSDKLIAVMSNPRSGTGMTVNMARKKGIDIKVIDINRLSLLFEYS